MALGEELRKIRKQHNMTKQELAKALNVPKDRIKLYESGVELPSEFYIKAFTQFFEISAEKLLVHN